MADDDRPVPPERGLTHDQVAEVLRRAAELDGTDEPTGRSTELVAPSVVEDAAVEAGLSRAAVRRALQELAVSPGGALAVPRNDAAAATDRIIVVRSVAADPAEARERIERYLRRQLFSRERIFDDGSWWTAQSSTAATTQRQMDLSGKLALRWVDAVEVRVVADHGGGSLVRIDLDIASLRRRRRRHVTRLGTLGTGAVGVAALVEPVALLFVTPASVGIAARGHVRGGRKVQQSIERIEVAVQGLLDRIEHDVPDSGASRARAAIRDPRRRGRSRRDRPSRDGHAADSGADDDEG